MFDQPKLHQQAVQRAEVGAVDPAPHGAVHDRRHCPRDDQAEAQELPAPGVRVDQLGNCQPQRQFQAHRDHRKVQGPPDRLPEGLVLEHVNVVAQAHKGPHLVDAGRRVEEAQDKGGDDRPKRDAQDHQQARGQQQPGRAGILLPQGES